MVYVAALHSAQLTTEMTFTPTLTYHLLVKLAMHDGILEATPCAGANSGDLLSLNTADAVISLPAGRTHFAVGESYPLTFLNPILPNFRL